MKRIVVWLHAHLQKQLLAVSIASATLALSPSPMSAFDVTLGTPVKAYANYPSAGTTAVAALDSGKFVLARGYQATVGTIEGNSTTIALNNGTVLSPGFTYGDSKVVWLDATRFVASWRRDNSAPGVGLAVGTVSGTSITMGPGVVLMSSTTNGDPGMLARLDDTRFVVIAGTGSDNGPNANTKITMAIGTVSGDTITFGTPVIIEDGLPDLPSVAALDSSHFVVAFRDNSPYRQGKSVVASVSGTTISFNSSDEVAFDSAGARYISVTAPDSNHYIISYTAIGDLSRGKAIAASVSGTTSFFGTPVTFSASTVLGTTVDHFDPTNFLIGYVDATNASRPMVIGGSIDGVALTVGAPTQVDTVDANVNSYGGFLATFNSRQFVYVYPDASFNAWVVAGTISDNEPEAICQNVTVRTEPGVCMASASVDNGSFDPDGDPITLDQAPHGPYGLGSTLVTLTVTDDSHFSDSCTATVRVMDGELPVVQCNAQQTITPPDAPIAFTATATDNCSVASVAITGFDCFLINPHGKRVDKRESCVVSFTGNTITITDSGGVGDHIIWMVVATDTSGNVSTQTCAIKVVKP